MTPNQLWQVGQALNPIADADLQVNNSSNQKEIYCRKSSLTVIYCVSLSGSVHSSD